MQAEVVTELDRLGEFAPGWDALAVANNRPRASPAWTLAWYRYALPAGAVIRVVVVTDGAAVVGVAPFYVVRTGAGFYRYELAAPMLHGVEPLYSPGRHEEVGHSFGATLAGADPTPDLVSLDWLPAGSLLVPALRAGWPGPRLGLVDGHTFPAPRVILGDRDFAAWVAARSSKFRAEFRSDHRKIVAAGFEHRMSTEPSDILDRLPDMQRLYERRRQARGGAGHTFDDRFMAVVAEAVTHSPSGRVRLSTIERPGEVVATDMVMSAGHESSFWLSGFDDAWANMSPGQVNVVLCVEESMQRGDEVFDMGPGTEPYKYRFTADEAILQGHLLVRRGLRPFHTPAQLLPFGARQAAGRFVGRLRRSA